ncbi:MAG: hypothetical protein AB7L17_08870 [Ilumatobacteraceae bacterium]
MTALTPTKDTGGRTKPMPGVYVEPSQQMTEEVLLEFLPDAGMNAPYMADFLSGMLAHERCGRHLYRTCETRSHNPMLQRKYQEFGRETERHVQILEDLITVAGGHPGYVSPTARAVQGSDTKLVESTFALAGGLDLMTAEMAMLDAVFLAESMDHANWKLLRRLTKEMDHGMLRNRFQEAVDEVEDQEDEHLEWATKTKERLVTMQAKSSMTAKMGEKAEEFVARIRGWLSDDS